MLDGLIFRAYHLPNERRLRRDLFFPYPFHCVVRDRAWIWNLHRIYIMKKNKPIIIRVQSRTLVINYEMQMRVTIGLVAFVYGAWIAWMLCGWPV